MYVCIGQMEIYKLTEHTLYMDVEKSLNQDHVTLCCILGTCNSNCQSTTSATQQQWVVLVAKKKMVLFLSVDYLTIASSCVLSCLHLESETILMLPAALYTPHGSPANPPTHEVQVKDRKCDKDRECDHSIDHCNIKCLKINNQDRELRFLEQEPPVNKIFEIEIEIARRVVIGIVVG